MPSTLCQWLPVRFEHPPSDTRIGIKEDDGEGSGATSASQGARRNDSMRCVEGELVWMVDACPASTRDPDGVCECFDAHGWCPCCTRRPVSKVVEELLDLARALPTGTVVERRLDWLNVRQGAGPDDGRAA